jgi:acyl-CoA dehydrogenase family member 9
MPPTIEQSFMKALFHGIIAEEPLFPYPEMPADERERTSLLLDRVRRFFAAGVDSVKIDREQAIDGRLMDELKRLGLMGLQVPAEYGGAGLSNMAYARVMQELGERDGSIALALGAHQSLGVKAILLFGTEEQKRRFLPRLATGERMAAFALTEEGAGSDASAIKTRAELSADGAHYTLNGSKVWVTNGGIADVFIVFARTSALEEGTKPRLTAFVVEREMGVTSGPSEPKLGVRGASTAELHFEDVRVPRENVLGERGKGFKIAVEVLDNGRLGLAASCLGGCSTLIRLALDRAQERRAFGRNIGDFGLIKDKIATMLARTYALESITYLTAGLVDAGLTDFSLESAVCKIVGSETLWYVADETTRIAAGSGYAQNQPYERLLRDARATLVFQGTNEILRCYVALSGMSGPGRALSDVVKAMREPIKGFGLLSDFALRKARTVLGRERMAKAHPLLSREAVIFEDYSGELAAQCENMLRKHGREISEMQYVQRRVAEMAMDLYCMAACIARATRAIERRGEDGARREIDLTTVFVGIAHKRLRQHISDFQKNDDELRKAVAVRAHSDRGYPFDVL